jgi:hypothetical protein
MKKIFFIVFAFFPLFAYPYKVTILYTGNSYSALYPCGHCPASVGGGITRRATLIEAMKKKVNNLILVDAGDFTAGGSLDEKSINPQMDRKRSIFYYQAMQEMGYEVVGIGEGEFNFGLEFLQENIKKAKFRFVSANINLKGVLPYYIKSISDSFSGITAKIAITALTPVSIYKKSGFKVEDYDTSLKSVIEKVRGKADFIILLSSLGDEENFRLAEKFPQLKLILSAGPMLSSSPYDILRDTILIRPSFQAKELKVLELDIEGGKLLNWQLKSERLPLSIDEKAEIKKMIPSCFQNSDCPKREGFLAECLNFGILTSSCVYNEAKRIEAILITDEKCIFCSTQVQERFLKDIFLGINFRIVDYRNKEAKEMIDKYSIDTLPCFIFARDIEKDKNFSKISNFLEKKEKKFILAKGVTGAFFFLKRKEIHRKIDFFLNPYSESAGVIFSDLLNFSKKNKIDLDIHFLVSESNVFGYPLDEVKIALAVKKLYPEKIFAYITRRLIGIKNIYWIDSLEDLGMDYKKIEGFAQSKDAETLLKEDASLARELGIEEGNVLLVNNNKVLKVFRIKEEDLKKLF